MSRRGEMTLHALQAFERSGAMSRKAFFRAVAMPERQARRTLENAVTRQYLARSKDDDFDGDALYVLTPRGSAHILRLADRLAQRGAEAGSVDADVDGGDDDDDDDTPLADGVPPAPPGSTARRRLGWTCLQMITRHGQLDSTELASLVGETMNEVDAALHDMVADGTLVAAERLQPFGAMMLKVRVYRHSAGVLHEVFAAGVRADPAAGGVDIDRVHFERDGVIDAERAEQPAAQALPDKPLDLPVGETMEFVGSGDSGFAALLDRVEHGIVSVLCEPPEPAPKADGEGFDCWITSRGVTVIVSGGARIELPRMHTLALAHYFEHIAVPDGAQR